MRKFLKVPPLLVWIACVAILLNALAPSISHALTARSSTPAVPAMEICTAHGVQSVMAAGQPDGGDAGPSQAGSSEHCPFCLPHGGHVGLPPSDMPVRPIVAGSDLFPHLFYHAPYRLFSWAAANPRGPPPAA